MSLLQPAAPSKISYEFRLGSLVFILLALKSPQDEDSTATVGNQLNFVTVL